MDLNIFQFLTHSGFHQVKVADRDVEKLAFITTEGLYTFLRMPFGVKNGPAHFQRLMDYVIAGLKYKSCVVYIDDLLVIGSNFEEHLKNLELVLSRIYDRSHS